jgi:thymidine kinase
MALNLILGPMFSGKSTFLTSEYLTYKYNNIPCSYITADIDNRDFISRNIQKEIKLEKFTNLDMDAYEAIKHKKIIFIDELHLYKKIDEQFIKNCLLDNKTIYTSGLNGDMNLKPFDNITKVLPYVTSLSYKAGICGICGNIGHYTVSNIKVKSKILVGDSDIYSIRCFKHI